MAYFFALLIFAGLSAGSWFAAVALYQATWNDGELTARPDYSTISTVVIIAVTMSCFFPAPAGFYLSLFSWGVAVFASLELSWGRGAVLFAYLSMASLLSRILILGTMEMFKG